MKKKLIAALCIVLAVVLIAGGAVGGRALYFNRAKSCDLTLSINENKVLQEFAGWGTSDCWWADDISDENERNEIADLLFGADGLKLDTYRYCIYGGYDPENNHIKSEFRLGESFYCFNEETKQFEYDWSRDANSQAMLRAALDRGVDTVVLFANSPHYSMCQNGRSSGAQSFDGRYCNIKADQYQNYVDYFLTITEHFINEGVPVKFISPINEPQWGWGGYNPRQEGCHYEPDEAIALLKLFAQGIKQRGLDVKLCAIESGEIGESAQDYYSRLTADSDINEELGVFSVHSYFRDNNLKAKQEFGKWASENISHRMDMTEWCELPTQFSTTDVKSACVMARVIANDITAMNVSGWSSWVAVNEKGYNENDGLSYSDGLLYVDTDNLSAYEIAYRYYAYMHFSKFVPEGSKIVECTDNIYTVRVTENDVQDEYAEYVNEAAFITPDNELVVVVVNEGSGRNMKIPAKYSEVTVYTTDSERKCENSYSGKPLEKYEIGENTINTFVFK